MTTFGAVLAVIAGWVMTIDGSILRFEKVLTRFGRLKSVFIEFSHNNPLH